MTFQRYFVSLLLLTGLAWAGMEYVTDRMSDAQFAANNRPAAGVRPASETRTVTGTRDERESPGGPYVLDENHSPEEAIVNENGSLMLKE